MKNRILLTNRVFCVIILLLGSDKMAVKNKPAIKVDNVTKSFKVFYDKPSTLKERLVFWNKKKAENREVLKNIDIEIEKGETVALIGTNGSGKSTLLKLMTKIIYPTKGKIKRTRLILSNTHKRIFSLFPPSFFFFSFLSH